jgi:hypothetical protein
MSNVTDSGFSSPLSAAAMGLRGLTVGSGRVFTVVMSGSVACATGSGESSGLIGDR